MLGWLPDSSRRVVYLFGTTGLIAYSWFVSDSGLLHSGIPPVLSNWNISSIFGENRKSSTERGSLDWETLLAGDAGLIHGVIENEARNNRISPDLVRAIIMVESNFNPYAQSSSGAGGLMQLMPATASLVGVNNVFDPADNVRGGCKYLGLMMDKFNDDEVLALAAYNAGPDAVEFYNGVPPFQETQKYVRTVIAYYSFFKGS